MERSSGQIERDLTEKVKAKMRGKRSGRGQREERQKQI